MPNTFERKILRRIYGPTHTRGDVGVPEPNTVDSIKIRRLEWAGHIIRMGEERIS
jgi:uncharacterized Rossmann fold enzyme